MSRARARAEGTIRAERAAGAKPRLGQREMCEQRRAKALAFSSSRAEEMLVILSEMCEQRRAKALAFSSSRAEEMLGADHTVTPAHLPTLTPSHLHTRLVQRSSSAPPRRHSTALAVQRFGNTVPASCSGLGQRVILSRARAWAEGTIRAERAAGAKPRLGQRRDVRGRDGQRHSPF